jgi:hypothetical protein
LIVRNSPTTNEAYGRSTLAQLSMATKTWLQKNTELHKEGEKNKTGKLKFSKLFRRTVFEYNHGIVCSCCRKTEIVTSFSPKTPKYCSEVCRQEVKRVQATAYYQKKKEQFRRIH